MRKIIDLAGQTFGKLKAIRIVETPPGKNPGEAYWLCECSCKEGRTKVVRGAELRAGRVKSCGCLLSRSPEELTPKAPKQLPKPGEQYGELKLIERVPRPEDAGDSYTRCSWWRCRCSCGKEVLRAIAFLRRAPYPHCGCKTEEIRMRQKKIGHDGMRYKTIDQYDGRPVEYTAKMRGVALNNKSCPMCKKEFDCYAGEEWAYKRKIGSRIGYFCSYSCSRKYDEAHQPRWSRAHD